MAATLERTPVTSGQGLRPPAGCKHGQDILSAGAELNRLYPVCIISTSNQATQRQNEVYDE